MNDPDSVNTESISRYRWVVMAMFQLALVTGWMMVFTIGLILPTMSEDLDISPSQQGLLSSIAVWAGIGVAVPLSWWTSKFSPTKLTTVTLLLACLSLFLQAFTSFFVVLLLGRLLLGLSLVAREPARALFIKQWFPKREYVLVQVMSNVFFTGAIGSGLIVTPIILNALGDDWRQTLLVYGYLLSGITILWIILGRDRVTQEYKDATATQQEIQPLKSALIHRDIWIGALCFVGTMTPHSAFLSFLPTMLLSSDNISLGWSGTIMAVQLFAGGVAGFFVMRICKAGRGKMTFGVLGIIMTITYLGFAFTGSVSLLFLIAVVHGSTWGFWPVTMTIPFIQKGISARGSAVGITFLITAVSLGSALGPLIAGYMQEILGNLQITLRIMSFAGLALTLTGLLVRSSSLGSEKTTNL